MKKQRNSFYFFVVLLAYSCAQTKDNSINLPEKQLFTPKLIVKNIQNPWGMDFLPDGSILITDKSGKLYHYKNGTSMVIDNLPKITELGQGGLLDIKLHPNYTENGWIYLSFASSEGGGNGANTAIMRAKLEGSALVEKQLLYKGTPNSSKGQHFGSRIVFDEEGFLYFSIGDRGDRDINPQDISRDGGKIYRLHDDGTIPSDNPFVNENGAKKAIYSYGHRNPQGLTIHPTTGKIWEHEHGPRGGDEINIIEKGKNYGWPVITYGINYSGSQITDETHRAGMEQPLHYWVPSIAPCGMTFVTSDKYPQWKGDLLVGSLVFQYLERLEIENDKVVYREKLLNGFGRLRNVKQAPDGYIYVGVEGKGVYRLEPNSQ